MKKIRNLFLVLIITLLAVGGATIAGAEEGIWFVEDMNQNTMLEPGTTTYCNKPFKVENLGKEMAEVHVILGNGSNYHWDQIEPQGTKSYDLKGGTVFSSPNGEAVQIDEARIVNATSGESRLKIHCQ